MTLEEQLHEAKTDLIEADRKYTVCLAQNGDFAQSTVDAYADYHELKNRVDRLKKKYKLETGTDWVLIPKKRLVPNSNKGKPNRGAHITNHANRNKTNPACKFCQEEAK